MVARIMERAISIHSPREWRGIKVVSYYKTQLIDALIESCAANSWTNLSYGYLLGFSAASCVVFLVAASLLTFAGVAYAVKVLKAPGPKKATFE